MPARLEFGAAVLRIPAGAGLIIYPSAGTQASAGSLKAVRMRLSANTPLTLQMWSQIGTDITVDLSNGYGVQLAANTAPPGQQATLYVSAPGMPEYALPIRIVEAVLLPFMNEIQVAPLNGAPATRNALFSFGAYDDGIVVPAESARFLSSTTRKLRTKLTPAGICGTSEVVELTGAGQLTLPFTCAGTGATVLELQPISGVSAAQTQFTVRIVSCPMRPFPPGAEPRVYRQRTASAASPL
ncbi:MAG: hypothetical protein IPP47_33045 [Bryobacterales bacterium]|nr:hypothetical protein [Bryobacterales bacterium]